MGTFGYILINILLPIFLLVSIGFVAQKRFADGCPDLCAAKYLYFNSRPGPVPNHSNVPE